MYGSTTVRFSIRVSRIPFLHLTETRRTREAEEPIARTEGLTEEKAEETEEDSNVRPSRKLSLQQQEFARHLRYRPLLLLRQ